MGRKILTIHLHIPDIVYNIQNQSHTAGRLRLADPKTPYEAAYDMQATDDDNESYRVNRSISAAYNNLKTALSEYVIDNLTTSEDELEKEIEGKGELSITLRLTDNYNDAASESVVSGAREYIVNSSLADWFGVTSKEESELYIAKASANLSNMLMALYRRARPQKPIKH